MLLNYKSDCVEYEKRSNRLEFEIQDLKAEL